MMRPPPRRLVSALAAACIAALPPAASGAGAVGTTFDLKQLDLEELFDLKVISVSRVPTELHTAPTAISVLTNEQIRRTGAVHLAELMRYVPGLQVTRFNSSSYGVTARGFNSNAGDKMQVMMDGRTLYTPLFAGVFWEFQDTVLEDLDRVEAVRGPGATLWGPNAVNGVINIVSKPADRTQGWLVSALAGTEERLNASIRYGGRTGADGAYRISFRHQDRDELRLASGAPASDGMRHTQGGFRFDTMRGGDALTLQGDVYENSFGILGRPDATNRGGNAIFTWKRTLAGDQALQFKAVYDWNTRNVPLQFRERRRTLDLDLQNHFGIGARHDVVAGINHRISADETSTDPSYTFQFDPPSRTVRPLTAFIQDRITVVPALLTVYVGSKFERNDYTRFEFQPCIRAAWTPTERQTFWAGFSQAVRRPTRVDTDTVFRPTPAGPVVLRGSKDFDSETVAATELGYRMLAHFDLTLDIATYYNHYKRIRTLEPSATIFPFVTANLREGETYGVEINVVWQPADWWRLSASFNQMNENLRFLPASRDTTGGSIETNDPRNTSMLHSAFLLPRGWEIDVIARHVGDLPNPALPRYTVVDARVGWQVTPALNLALVGQNLLDRSHPEFGAATARSEIERGYYVKATWTR